MKVQKGVFAVQRLRLLTIILGGVSLLANCSPETPSSRDDVTKRDDTTSQNDVTTRDTYKSDEGVISNNSSGDASVQQTDTGVIPDQSSDGQVVAQLDECQTLAPDWVFCSSFEEGNKDVWDDYDGNPDETNLLMADPGPFGLAGNHVMRLRVPPGRGYADLVKVLPETADRMYARWYVKWEAGYDFTALNHGSGLNAGNRNYLGQSDYQPDGDDFFGSWIEPNVSDRRLFAYTYYRGMYMNCADPNGACWGDMFPCTVDEGEVFCEKPQHREGVLPPAMEADRWYCIELMLDGGTPTSTETGANGELNFWVDGQEIGPWTDLWLRTSSDVKVSLLFLNLFHHDENHSTEGLMLDHVVVSKSRIGCLN